MSPPQTVESLVKTILEAQALRIENLVKMILEAHNEKHDSAHSRVRQSVRDIQMEMDAGFQSHRTEMASVKTQVTAIVNTPVDATKLVLSTRVIVTILVTLIGATLTIGGSIWSLGTRIDAQRTSSENAREVQKLESNNIKAAIEGMQRRQELQQYEIQGLKEAIITGKAKPAVR